VPLQAAPECAPEDGRIGWQGDMPSEDGSGLCVDLTSDFLAHGSMRCSVEAGLQSESNSSPSACRGSACRGAAAHAEAKYWGHARRRMPTGREAWVMPAGHGTVLRPTASAAGIHLHRDTASTGLQRDITPHRPAPMSCISRVPEHQRRSLRKRS